MNVVEVDPGPLNGAGGGLFIGFRRTVELVGLCWLSELSLIMLAMAQVVYTAGMSWM